MWKFLEPLKAWLRFWRLTTTWVYKIFQEWNHLRWKDECICDCWKIIYARRTYLYDWRVQSCWCLAKQRLEESRTKHWDYDTRFYKIWDWMVCRCNNKNRKCRERYWGRWIKVCDEWLHYEKFKKDMFDKYNKIASIYWEQNISIERINNDKWYYKENCKWTTMKEQCSNRRNNIKIDYKGKHYESLALLCDELWLTEKWYKAIHGRLKRWQSIEDAVANVMVLYNKTKAH